MRRLRKGREEKAAIGPGVPASLRGWTRPGAGRSLAQDGLGLDGLRSQGNEPDVAHVFLQGGEDLLWANLRQGRWGS